MGKKIRGSGGANHCGGLALTAAFPIQEESDETPKHGLVSDILDLVYPVGSVYLSIVDTNPGTLFGGTWSQIAGGRALFGQTSGDTDFDAGEETGGSKTSTALLAHTHGLTDPGHNHTQDAHTHTQNSHNHTQDAHTHTQNSHSHTEQAQGGTTASTTGTHLMTSTATGGSLRSSGQSTVAATATNQNATATNQAATATNQNTTATNQANTTGVTVDSAGSGSSFSILPPYLVVYVWKRTA